MANSIGTAYVDIKPNATGFSGALSKAIDGEASSAGASAGGKLSSALGAAAQVGVAAIAGMTTAMVGFGASAVSAGSDFDAAMSQVAATMGFSIDELNDSTSKASQDFQQLRDFAQEMGSTTAFSATEASQALNYMALAGYDATTSMDMLPTVLNLAAAGGIDLASASDMVTDAQSALGLSLEDTKTMVDQMASASSKSNTSVAQLGEAFLTIGANAKSLSGGTAELSTALGILADNGIKGAEGGTHLRNIMLALNPTTDKAVNAWEQLGVSAYDAQGNLRPLEDTFGDLNTAMEGMTDQEKTDIIGRMFNKTDLASVNALLATTSDRWTELGDAIVDSTDAAENMANVQLDNLQGDVTMFKSAMEGLQIVVSDALTPSLRDFVQLGTDGIGEITAALKMGDIEGAFQNMADYFEAFLKKIIDMLPEVVSCAEKLVQALGKALLNEIDTIVDVAIQIVMFLVQGLIDALPKLVDAAVQIINKLATAIVDALPEMIPQIVQIITHICDVIRENLPTLIEAAVSILVQLADGMAENLPEMIPQIVDTVIFITETLIDHVDELVDASLKIIVALAEGLIDALPELAEKIPEIIIKIVETIVENLDKIIEVAGKIIIELAVGLIKALPELIKEVPKIIYTIIEGIANLRNDLLATGADIVNGIWEGIKGMWEDLKNWVREKASELVDTMTSVLRIGSPSKVFRDEVGKWIPAGIAVGIEANSDSVSDAMQDMTSQTLEAGRNFSAEVATQSQISMASGYNSSGKEEAILNMLQTYLPGLATNDKLNNLNFSVNNREFARMVNGVS